MTYGQRFARGLKSNTTWSVFGIQTAKHGIMNINIAYRCGGKTLCALYAREHCIEFMLIFGKVEREKLEADRQNFSQAVQRVYDEAQTHCDGKWVMFTLDNTSMFKELIRLLQMKRKPNRK